MVSGRVHAGEVVTNGFFARMQRGTGHFFTPADLANGTAGRTIDLFQGLAGVRRQADRGNGERIVVRGASGYCVPAVLVDGVRVTWTGIRSGLDDIVPFETLLAVEVHRGVTGIPIEFGSFKNCGLLVFWTK
jgi:outer membrane cobalamin receptor